MPEAPYGTWPSPISSELVASTGQGWGRFDEPQPTADGVYWLEARPLEGRTVLVFKPWDGDEQDMVPTGFNVRNSVHEYGGGSYWLDGSTVQHLLHRGGIPIAVVPNISPEEHARAHRDAARA